MTLNADIRVLWIFDDFVLRYTFQKRIVPKSIEIDMDKLHTKFSALNADFLDFLGSRKPAHKGIKEPCPRIYRYFTVVGQSFVKAVADHHVMLPIVKSTSDELFSRIKIDDLERP